MQMFRLNYLANGRRGIYCFLSRSKLPTWTSCFTFNNFIVCGAKKCFFVTSRQNGTSFNEIKNNDGALGLPSASILLS